MNGGSSGLFDADGHVVEPDEMWQQYLAKRLWPAAPRWVRDSEGRTRRLIGGRLQPYVPFPPGKHYFGDTDASVFDAAARVALFDRHGIARGVLTPSAGLHFGAIREIDVQVPLCEAYNRWVAELCATVPQRLFWVALVAQSDVCAMVAEAERALAAGAQGILLRPNPIGDRTLDDPAFDPLWDVLATADRPVVLHEATTMNVPEAGTDRFTNYLYLHAVSQPHEHQMACIALVCGGVLERHPGLRVAFFEAGAGWVPYWLERMDQHVRYWGHTSRRLELLPSEYFLRQCYVSPFADEATLPHVVAQLGSDNFVFTSDLPMPYTDMDRVTDALMSRADLDDTAKANIGRHNAERLYGLT